MFWTITGLVLICLLTMAAIAFPIWAIVDVVSHPEEEWRAAGRRQTTWLFMLIAGTFVFLLAGNVAALYYVLAVRPHLLESSASRPSGPPSRASDDPSDTLPV